MISSKTKKILFVEDESDVLAAAKLTLELEGFEVIPYCTGEHALQHDLDDFPGIIISDVRMPGMTGLELQQALKELDQDLPVILVTGHGDIEMAVQAVKAGAWEFLEKPVEPSRLISEVIHAQQHRTLVLENRLLKKQLGNKSTIDQKLLGEHSQMCNLRKAILNISQANVDVLIFGETGTGKDLVARTLHEFSDRKNGNFVALNCGALSESVIESELFGHEQGAFTGAQKRRIGKLEHASGGTLFLDELESMPLYLQIKLLRVLQERSVERLGGNDTIPIDVRVVAATKIDLTLAIEKGTFREDLYYRLNVATLIIPPLRERKEDIPLLFKYYQAQASLKFDRDLILLNSEQIDFLMAQPWQGNIRELIHEAERYTLGISPILQTLSISKGTAVKENELTSLPNKLASYEKRLLVDALLKFDGRISLAADSLGIPRKKLYLRLQKYNIEKHHLIKESDVWLSQN